MDIGPGDRVECVDDRPFMEALSGEDGPKSILIRGLIYKVSRVIREGEPHPVAGCPWFDAIDLVEAPMPPIVLGGNSVFWGYDIRRFRPVRRPDPKTIADLRRAAHEIPREVLEPVR